MRGEGPRPGGSPPTSERAPRGEDVRCGALPGPLFPAHGRSPPRAAARGPDSAPVPDVRAPSSPSPRRVGVAQRSPDHAARGGGAIRCVLGQPSGAWWAAIRCVVGQPSGAWWGSHQVRGGAAIRCVVGRAERAGAHELRDEVCGGGRSPSHRRSRARRASRVRWAPAEPRNAPGVREEGGPSQFWDMAGWTARHAAGGRGEAASEASCGPSAPSRAAARRDSSSSRSPSTGGGATPALRPHPGTAPVRQPRRTPRKPCFRSPARVTQRSSVS